MISYYRGPSWFPRATTGWPFRKVVAGREHTEEKNDDEGERTNEEMKMIREIVLHTELNLAPVPPTLSSSSKKTVEPIIVSSVWCDKINKT